MTARSPVRAEALKPCPFCGGAKVTVGTNTYKDLITREAVTLYRVLCCRGSRCGADGPAKKSERAAIAAWNRRTP
jgi:Lar family restriction alleviation protein